MPNRILVDICKEYVINKHDVLICIKSANKTPEPHNNEIKEDSVNNRETAFID